MVLDYNSSSKRNRSEDALQVVVQKTNYGFVNSTPANASRYLANETIIQATSAVWYGHSANSATSGSTVLLAYGYSHEVDQWRSQRADGYRKRQLNLLEFAAAPAGFLD